MCGLGWEDVRRVWFQEDATACAKGAAWRNTARSGKESVSMSAVEGVKEQRGSGEGSGQPTKSLMSPVRAMGTAGGV